MSGRPTRNRRPDQVTPLVTVVIPAYNVEQWIFATIESVLKQTYKPVEVVVVNDGSTDGTAEVIAGFGDRVRCVTQPNKGLSAARNTGIRVAEGQFIAFLDSDDLWMPEKLECQVDLLRRFPEIGWVYSDAFVVDHTATIVLNRVGRTSSLPSGDILRALILRNFIPCPTPLVRRSALARVGGFDESPAIQIAEDWDMWLRLAGEFPAGCVSRPLAMIRLHGKSMTGTMDLDAALASKMVVIEKAVRLRPAALLPLRARAVAGVYLDMGEWMFRREKFRDARLMFASAIRVRSLTLHAIPFWLITFLPSKAVHSLALFRRRLNRGALALRDLAQPWRRRDSR